MPTQRYIYATYLIGINGGCIYVPHIKSMASTMWPQALDTYFTNCISWYWYTSINKYGCYIAHISHTAIILYGHTDPILMQTQHPLHMLLPYMFKKQIWLQIGNLYHMCKIFDVHIWGMYVHMCTTSEVMVSPMRPWTLHTDDNILDTLRSHRLHLLDKK